jgi:hypothetical protein
MAAKLPDAADWMMQPTMVIKPFKIKLNLRPHRSATQEARKHPRKHPAWRVEAMFADRSACPTLDSLSRPYSLVLVSNFRNRSCACLLHEGWQRKNTTDSPDIEAEKHASEARRACQGKSSPAIDLWRIRSGRFVLDDLVDETSAEAGLAKGIVVCRRGDDCVRHCDDNRSTVGPGVDEDRNDVLKTPLVAT